MSDIVEISTEIKEQTPILHVPITIKNPKALTYEERQEAYAVLRQFSDFHLLPLPEEFWDEDPFSERGAVQLEHDAHIVGLMNAGLLTLSAEKEEMYRSRLRHKIDLVRKASGITSAGDGSIERLEGIDGVSLEGSAETRADNSVSDQSALKEVVDPVSVPVDA